ncbi:MAG: Gfo/Idh/MocA family oxidoreductase [Chthoniobacteraceae bacterium]
MTTKTSASPLNIGIAGLGWPGFQHAIALGETTTGRVYSCADPDKQRQEKFNAEFHAEKTFQTVEEMVDDPDLDAIVICLPNALHFSASLAALQKGKHVFCEKPPTLNAAEMKVLQEEATKRGLVYFFGRQMRFSAEMLACKKAIEDGRLGNIYFARAIWVRSRGTPTGIGGWFTDKSKSGGGALIDIGVHALDAVWYLMGTPRPISVSAQVFRNFDHLVDVPKFDVDDAAYGFIRFENGAVVQLETSWAANLPDDVPGEGSKRELQNTLIYGSKATLRVNPLAMFEDQKGELVTVPLDIDTTIKPFTRQIENFLDSILTKTEPVNSAQQAVYLMEMLDAIYLSSEKKQEIPIAR